MLDAYFDESGSHDDRGLVIAGFIAEADKWADMSVRWKSLLDEYRVPFIHMTRLRGTGRDVRHLSTNDKGDLLRALVALIVDTVRFGIATCCKPSAISAALPVKYRHGPFGSPYSILITMALVGVVKTLETDPASDRRIGIFIEDGHVNSQQAVETIKTFKDEIRPFDLPDNTEVMHGILPVEDRLQSIRECGLRIATYGLGDRLSMIPLQAADILAHCLRGEAVRSDPLSIEIMDQLRASVSIKAYNLSPELARRLVALDANEKTISRRFTHEFIGCIRREFGVPVEKLPYGLLIRGDQKI